MFLLANSLCAFGVGAGAAFDACVAVGCTAGTPNGRATRRRGAGAARNTTCGEPSFATVGSADGGARVNAACGGAASDACASARCAAGTPNEPFASKRSSCAAGNATGAGTRLAVY